MGDEIFVLFKETRSMSQHMRKKWKEKNASNVLGSQR